MIYGMDEQSFPVLMITTRMFKSFPYFIEHIPPSSSLYYHYRPSASRTRT